MQHVAFIVKYAFFSKNAIFQQIVAMAMTWFQPDCDICWILYWLQWMGQLCIYKPRCLYYVLSSCAIVITFSFPKTCLSRPWFLLNYSFKLNILCLQSTRQPQVPIPTHFYCGNKLFICKLQVKYCNFQIYSPHFNVTILMHRENSNFLFNKCKLAIFPQLTFSYFFDMLLRRLLRLIWHKNNFCCNFF